MTFTKNTYIEKMNNCCKTAYNTIKYLLEEKILFTLDDEDIEHLEATQKILGIITDIYDDITTTIVGDEIEKKESQK